VEAFMSRNPPFDGLDDVLNPLRHAQRLAEELSGANYARTLAQEMGSSSIRDLINQHHFGLSERELRTLQSRATDPGLIAYAAQMESASEQARRLIDESALGTVGGHDPASLTALSNLHDMGRAWAFDDAMRDASALADRWLDDHSVAALMRDAAGLALPGGLDEAAWSQLVDPIAQMQALARQLEPLGQLIERHAHIDPFTDTIARLQRDWDAARRGVFDVDGDVLLPQDQDDTSDEFELEFDADADDAMEGGAHAEALDPDASAPTQDTPPEVVPEYFIAARFLSGVALVRARTARLAARFDARVASAPEALSDWLLVISGNQPAYAARIGVLSCRVLHGAWLWNACLQDVTGETLGRTREGLTVTDANEFDEAVNALVRLLDDIEDALDA
jgi:hypothetical protein